jgi:hypothetical protein
LKFFVLLVLFFLAGIWETLFSQTPINTSDDSYLIAKFDFKYFDIYRSESKTSQFKSYFSTKSLNLDYKRENLFLSISLDDPQFYVSSKNSRDDNFSFKGVSGRRSIEPRIIYEDKFFNIGTAFTFYENQKIMESSFSSFLTIKFNTTIINRFKIGVSKESFPLISDITYSTEQVSFNNDLKFYKLYQSLEIGKYFNSDWKIETFQQWKFDEKQISQEHYLSNSGNFYGTNISAEFFDKQLCFSSSYLAGDGKLVFEYDKNSYGEENFSDIVFIKGEINSTLLSSLILIDEFKIGFMNFRGKSTGEIQSWPFTDVITSAIANRIYYRGNFNLINYYMQIKKKYKISEVEIYPELFFAHLIPKGEIENWQPLFLVFGVKDFRQSKMLYKNIGLMHFGIELKKQINQFLLTLSGGQIIQIYQSKIETTKIVQVSTTPSLKTKTDGGRWISVSLQYSLNL